MSTMRCEDIINSWSKQGEPSQIYTQNSGRSILTLHRPRRLKKKIGVILTTSRANLNKQPILANKLGSSSPKEEKIENKSRGGSSTVKGNNSSATRSTRVANKGIMTTSKPTKGNTAQKIKKQPNHMPPRARVAHLYCCPSSLLFLHSLCTITLSRAKSTTCSLAPTTTDDLLNTTTSRPN